MADLHDFPPTKSDERLHVFSRGCWCEPEVLGTHVVHHTEQEVLHAHADTPER